MAYLISQTIPQWFDNNGSPAAGALLNVYTAGTLTFLATYTTSALSVAHANPQVADSAGRFANAYIADGSDFKIIITDSTAATTFRETDNIHATDAAGVSAIDRSYESKSSDYTLVAGDNKKFIDFDASGADRVVTANSATLLNGFEITIGRRSTIGLVTITPGGGQVIDGQSSYIIDTDYEAVTIVSMGATGWRFAAQTSREPQGELVGINNQAGTTYTLAIGDKGKLVIMTNAAPNILTIPANATVAFPILTRIEVRQGGAGETSIAPAVGVTLNSPGTFRDAVVQHSGMVLTKEGTNTWWLAGDIEA